ncbi:MAG: hypothetical protein BWK75_00955 [Candidatus Altiarchaeales archaeon A3]|nr:MAG: hypothetical protein BWK75_00955 [Candidatus Altiarchaeales archaeon A3]
MINRQEIPSLMALTHTQGWNYEQINNLFTKINRNAKSSIAEFFCLSSKEWSDHFGLSKKETDHLENVKKEIPKYSFLAEDLFAQGYEIILINSPEYSETLKENLGSKSPPLIYVKGNKNLLKENLVAIVGSRDASEIALKFTDNIAMLASGKHKVVVSGFARGVDRQALDSALKYKGKGLIVLPQGIMTFYSGFKNYYKQIVEGNVLVLSTFFPKALWSVELAMARNSVIYGLAGEIYVAESNETGGTWSGVMDGIRKGRKIYVRKPESYENKANDKLIDLGVIPVSFEGRPVLEYKSLSPEICMVKEKHE